MSLLHACPLSYLFGPVEGIDDRITLVNFDFSDLPNLNVCVCVVVSWWLVSH